MEKCILLCPNPHRDIQLATTRRAKALLEGAGHRVRISTLLGAGLEDTIPSDLKVEPMEETLPDARLMVTLGGDGTILHASHEAFGTDVPMLGVNLGHKGFLTELEETQLDRLLDAAEGKYTLLRRMMLDVHLLRQGEVIVSGCALNEAVINGIVTIVQLEAYGDGMKIMSFAGDGLIACSPTGATAYSMAAGGPLVEPDAENIIITPICSYRLAARSFVLAPGRKVSIRPVELGERKAILSIDGGQQTILKDGDVIQVCRSTHATYMAQLNGKSFYDIAYEKLSDQN